MHSLQNPPSTPRPTNFRGAIHRADGAFIGYVDMGDSPMGPKAILEISYTGPIAEEDNFEHSQQWWLDHDGEWMEMHTGSGVFEMPKDGCQGEELPDQQWLNWLAPLLLGEFGPFACHLGTIRTQTGWIAMWMDDRTGKLHLDNTNEL